MVCRGKNNGKFALKNVIMNGILYNRMLRKYRLNSLKIYELWDRLTCLYSIRQEIRYHKNQIKKVEGTYVSEYSI